jgi:hypothetical protein
VVKKNSQFLNKTNVKIKTSTKPESTILTHNMFVGKGGVGVAFAGEESSLPKQRR